MSINAMARFGLLVFLVLTCSWMVRGLPETVKVGAIFETGDDSLEEAFKFAVKRVNDKHILGQKSKLQARIERIGKQDSFQSSRKVCSLLKEGVAAIFGPQSPKCSAHVQSACNILEVPHVNARWDIRNNFNSNLSVNLFPSPKILGKAFVDLVKSKDWKTYAILYEENEALVRLQEILKDPMMSERRIIVRQFQPNMEYRKLLKELRRLQVKNIILDVPTDKILPVLRHAQEVNMMTEYHNYLITSLDTHTLDLEEFQTGGTNISSFMIVDSTYEGYAEIKLDLVATVVQPGIPKSERKDEFFMRTEVALMYDAVRLFAQALYDLDRTQSINIHSISCDREDSWPHGSALISYMKRSAFHGLTGDVKFDSTGMRNDLKLKMLHMTLEGLEDIGTWTATHGINITTNFTKSYQAMENKTVIVTTILNQPYMMLHDDAKDRIGNDKYFGFCVDLMNEIALLLKFKYTIKLVDDGNYGAKNEHGEWNGMIREVLDGKADLAIADLTVTYVREEAVDFTMPFMNLGISILFKKPTKKAPKLFSFLAPLSLEVWVFMATAFLGVSLLLFIVARFSPYEWINPHPCDQTPDTYENQFNIVNTLWFTIGCLMQQGCDLTPKAISTRIVAGTWWFFILIMVSSYTANLAAFLTVQRMSSPIESAEDLAKQTEIAYGCVGSGSTKAFFQTSNITTYKKMWAYMESARPSVFTESNKKGIDRVKKGKYAFLMESTTIEFNVERDCELIQVGGLLDSKGYGIATPSGILITLPTL